MAIYLMLEAVVVAMGSIVADWTELCFLIPICVVSILVLNGKNASGAVEHKNFPPQFESTEAMS